MSNKHPPHKPDAQLRDARLAQALQHAPDMQEHAQPTAARREAILRAAHDAVAAAAPHARSPWWLRWRGWWDSVGADMGRLPRNTALATVLLAGLITVLWNKEPIPTAQVDKPAPTLQDRASPSPAPQYSEKAADMSPHKAAPVPPTVAALPQEAATRQPPPQASGSPRLKDRAAVEMDLVPHSQDQDGMPIPKASPRPDPSMASVDRKASAPATSNRQAAAKDMEMASAAAPAAAIAAAPPPPAAPSLSMPQHAPAALVPALSSALPADWTHVRSANEAPDAPSVPRAAAGDLPRLLGALGAEGDVQEALQKQARKLSAAPASRVALLRHGAVLGVLELSGQRWRFVPEPGSGLALRQGLLPEADAQALQAALQRVGR